MKEHCNTCGKWNHEYLLIASYCGDEQCIEIDPCRDCLAMCNKFRSCDVPEVKVLKKENDELKLMIKTAINATCFEEAFHELVKMNSLDLGK